MLYGTISGNQCQTEPEIAVINQPKVNVEKFCPGYHPEYQQEQGV